VTRAVTRSACGEDQCPLTIPNKIRPITVIGGAKERNTCRVADGHQHRPPDAAGRREDKQNGGPHAQALAKDQIAEETLSLESIGGQQDHPHRHQCRDKRERGNRGRSQADGARVGQVDDRESYPDHREESCAPNSHILVRQDPSLRPLGKLTVLLIRSR
jgi:hypothetical protein